MCPFLLRQDINPKIARPNFWFSVISKIYLHVNENLCFFNERLNVLGFILTLPSEKVEEADCLTKGK